MNSNKETSSFKKAIHILKVCKKLGPKYFNWMIFKGILSSITPFISIYFSYRILDGLVTNQSFSNILVFVILLISLNLLFNYLLNICTYKTSTYEILLSWKLSYAISLKCCELDYEQLEDKEVMDLIKKAQDGSNSNGGLSNYCRMAFENIMKDLLQVIYAIVLISGLIKVSSISLNSGLAKFLNHPLSISIIVVTIIFVALSSLILAKKDNKLSYDCMLKNIDGNRKFGYFYSLCVNYKYGKDIRLFHMQPLIINMMKDKKFSVDSNWRKYATKSIQWKIVLILCSKLLLFISYLYVGLKAYYGLISIGSVVSYVSAITLLDSSIRNILMISSAMSQSNHYLDHYFSFLNLPTKMKYGQEVFDTSKCEIEFIDVCFSYPHQTQEILHNINLKISNKEKIAIVGQNGAGKTTLIKLLCRLYEPTSGKILINGKDISMYSKESLYDAFSIVFQDFNLFSYSIEENICQDNKVDTIKLENSLKESGIENRINKMEKGVKTVIYQRNKEQGVEISGGEAQKIAIARALYKDAPFVILDEPTAALDPISESEVYDKFNELVSNKTSIFISHRMSSCKFCERILVFSDGRIIQSGNHQALLNETNGLYKRLWDAQAKYYQ